MKTSRRFVGLLVFVAIAAGLGASCIIPVVETGPPGPTAPEGATGPQGPAGETGLAGVLGFYRREGSTTLPPDGAIASVNVACHPGDAVTGGGFAPWCEYPVAEKGFRVLESGPDFSNSSESWHCVGYLEEGDYPSSGVELKCFAICADVTP